MTIRKRYDEAVQLFQSGAIEPSLILALVATAAAAELYRKKITNGAPKNSKKGDDTRYFKEYVNQMGLDKIIMIEDKPIPLAHILYKQLRCEAIHEAVVNSAVFVDEDCLVRVDGEVVKYGRQLVPALLDHIRNDANLRDQFRDQLTPFENIIEPPAGVDREAFSREIKTRFSIDGLDYWMIEQVVTMLRPERLKDLSKDELDQEFRINLIPSLEAGGQDGQFFGTLASYDSGIFDRDDRRLTEKGFNVFRAISSNYVTIDAGPPFP